VLLPSCDYEEYVFVTLPSLPSGLEPVAAVIEPEGLSVVLRRAEADRRGYAYDFVAAWIVLGAETSLAEVGITAAIATELARLGISCNVIAGVHHDHFFVPHDRSREAVEAIADLS
jgi:uncharacterized protein